MSGHGKSVRTPGAPARGTRTGRPMMVLFDVLGRRWTLRILWEMRGGALNFRALRSRCDNLSPTVLNERLKQLRALGLVELREEGYAWTPEGEELGRKLAELDCWADRWAATLEATKKSDQ